MNILEIMRLNDEILKDINTIFSEHLEGNLEDWLIELENRLTKINEALDEYDEKVREINRLVDVLTKLP